MNTQSEVAEQVKHEVRKAARKAAPWVERLARFGYASKGVVYATMGVLAVRAAVRTHEHPSDPRGALFRIGEQPFGQFLLVTLALGLIGYALWQVTRAVRDPEHQGHGAKGVIKRVGYFVSGVVYTGLAWYAFRLATARAQESNTAHDDWTATFLSWPLGEFLVGAAGVVALAVAANQAYVAWTAAFLKRIRFGGVGERRCATMRLIGQIGIAARGVVLAIIGWFLLDAAWTHNPERAGGIRDALVMLERAPAGPWLLGVVAVGVFAYGLFAFVQAAYRRIHVD